MSGTATDAAGADVKGERGAGVASVAEERDGAMGRGLIVALISLAGVGFLYLIWGRGQPQPSAAADGGRTPVIAPAAPFTPAAAPRASRPPAVPQAAAKEPAPEDSMLEAGMRAPVIAYSSNAGQTRRGQGRGGEDHGGGVLRDLAPRLPGGGQRRHETLQDKLRPTRLEGVRAAVLPDLHMIVPQGTSIPCVLQTAISSDQPGFVSCVIPRDVLSASGQVVLMEKGTVVVGEYEGGPRQGRKMFVLWNRARTPRGVVIDLASPAADGLGRAGFNGGIDSHFWERFGGAVLMSIVSDASSYGFGRLNDGAQIEIGTTEQAANSAAATALKNSIGIQPTLYKNQGAVVSIFVARDLDFSSVYDLKLIESWNEVCDRAAADDMRCEDESR